MTRTQSLSDQLTTAQHAAEELRHRCERLDRDFTHAELLKVADLLDAAQRLRDALDGKAVAR